MPHFVDDIAAAVDALGVEKVGIVWGVGMTNWSSQAERDQFLADMAKPGTPGA